VQSACGRFALEKQLADAGIDVGSVEEEQLKFLNMIWADNGDWVSKQYSSTAALKGDYTRTRKRNISGALNDFGLTLTRYWNNIITDFFLQAAMDYLLGIVTERSSP